MKTSVPAYAFRLAVSDSVLIGRRESLGRQLRAES
jgi:hypothetical protein